MTDSAEPNAYFVREDATHFTPTVAVEGAWRTDEQHIAPGLGLTAHIIERDHVDRVGDGMTMSRVSFDILGVIPMDTVEITTRVLRPGRTIELVEATMSHGGRPALLARAWFMSTADTTGITGSGFDPIPPYQTMDTHDFGGIWPGRAVNSIAVHRAEAEPGRAQFWIRPKVPLLAGETISPTARLVGMLDFANGMTPRVSPRDVAFPNLDLTAHLFTTPRSEWIGFDTRVSIGADGRGLTQSILHDENGPIGTSAQSLTVRP